MKSIFLVFSGGLENVVIRGFNQSVDWCMSAQTCFE